MKLVWNSAFALLLVTGALLGLTLPFGKIATQSGVPGMVWAFVVSLGAGGILFPALLASGRRIRLTAHRLRYFVVTAAISYAFPNLLMFSAIPHLGAGYTGIMFTLSPVITLVFSILLGVRRPNPAGVIGIGVGFVGAAMVALTRGEAGQPASLFSEVRHDERTGVDLILVGKAPGDAQAILSSEALADTMQRLRHRYDHVVADSAPVLGLRDTKVVARLVDATIIAVRSQSTPTAAVRAAIDELREASAPLRGAVITQADGDRQPWDGYGG